MDRIAGITAMLDIQEQIRLFFYLKISISCLIFVKGDGIWGSICGVIGSGIGIAAGCIDDRSIFKALYIAHSTLVSFWRLDEGWIS